MIPKITKEQIKDLYIKYNKLYFNGVLPKCKCHVFKGRSCYGFYSYQKNNKAAGIWIAYNVEWTEETLRECVVHEMIHHYIRTIEGHRGGLLGHNWRFRRQCRRLKKEFGINITVFGYENMLNIGLKRRKKTIWSKIYSFFYAIIYFF